MVKKIKVMDIATHLPFSDAGIFHFIGPIKSAESCTCINLTESDTMLEMKMLHRMTFSHLVRCCRGDSRDPIERCPFRLKRLIGGVGLLGVVLAQFFVPQHQYLRFR